MSNINYDELKEITVHNQQGLDDVPKDYKGYIYVDCTTTVIIRERCEWRIELRNNSRAVLWENSSAELRENSSAELCENSSAELWENSSAVLRDNSRAVLRNNSSAVLRENSSAELCENSSAELFNNSSAELWGNSQVVNRSSTCEINLNGNAREVFMPRNIHEYFDFYGIKHTKTTATMYKAVRKRNGIYCSDHTPSFEYYTGKSKTEICDTDTLKECASGIHIAYLDWALRFGEMWDDLAILEVQTQIADIVIPENCDGKVRTSKVKILREVPLEECGIYGKILAQRRAAQNKL